MNSERKVTGYQVIKVGVYCPDIAEFRSHVANEMWGEGWQPWGSPFAMNNTVYQAFVKYEP